MIFELQRLEIKQLKTSDIYKKHDIRKVPENAI